MNKLAIIIPAYKADFFRDALVSIANQTNKYFHLYIGDDNSPENLCHFIEEFKAKINLTYVKFENNLGQNDLVAHWERCIELSRNEDWIWLFSDDDVMAPNCVAEFYKALEDDISLYLYHLNVKVIDANGKFKLSEKDTHFPSELNAFDFLYGRMSSKYRSYVVEYIFPRKSYEEYKGFPNFDLAWNSDDAMWFQISTKLRIKTLSNANVFWRASDVNISQIEGNKEFAVRKLRADLSYLSWLQPKIRNFNLLIELKLKFRIVYWFCNRLEESKDLIGITVFNSMKSKLYDKVCPFKFAIFIYFLVKLKRNDHYKKVRDIFIKKLK